MERIIELKPIKETTQDYDVLERRIRELFKQEIYISLVKELSDAPLTLQNASDKSALLEAIRTGRVTFSRGQFSGRFSSRVSKELSGLGAEWDRKTGTWRVSHSVLPMQMRAAIAASETKFNEKIAGIERKLAQILPDEIAGKFKGADLFDRTLWKTEKAFQASVKNLAMSPELPADRRKKIADEWQENMRLYIRDFAEEEISKLRKRIKKSVFTGNRYESMVKTIQASYGVSVDKAKFLARQETSLLMTKYKESRYLDAGVKEYRWGCVAGSKLHPVRPAHKRLEGKIFRWDNPPITTEPGQPQRRNNPGQDYNCRCFARPVVRFKE